MSKHNEQTYAMRVPYTSSSSEATWRCVKADCTHPTQPLLGKAYCEKHPHYPHLAAGDKKFIYLQGPAVPLHQYTAALHKGLHLQSAAVSKPAGLPR